ncbi:MAG: hypothetical protein IT223_06775 [Crocinitomicaceae bacterium]|nr:hypothetical protein [Crocinitomicaceae bacterium]
MKNIFTLVFAFCLLQGFSQGVKIGVNPGTPDPSSILDVESNAGGFLPPRMSEAERDNISNPADGLVLFNTTTNCLNFRVAGFWKEVCGECTPAPSPANAGADQLAINGNSTTLGGNDPQSGTGTWSVVSGSGGSITDASLYNTTFSGSYGTTYVLRWTISSICGNTQDDVTISFAANWKYVFVTRDNVNGTGGYGSGNLGGLNGADNLCQTRASAAGLSGTYKAWLSDGSFSAASRLNHYSGEYRLLNGTKIADNWADLTDGSLDNKLNVTEYGLTLPGTVVVYTGTNTDGSADGTNNCSNWTSSSPNVWVRGGNGDVTNTEWTFWVFAGCEGAWGTGWKLYCFEQ